jgi:hypothetical protein
MLGTRERSLAVPTPEEWRGLLEGRLEERRGRATAKLELVGLQEIAELLGERYSTGRTWRTRGQLPPEDWTVSGTRCELLSRVVDEDF